MEKCLFGKVEVALPNLLAEDVDIFLEVVSASTWQNELTDNQRHNLTALLPTFGQNDIQEKTRTLQGLFSGENFKFGNPLQQFHKKLREGRFSPEIAKYTKMIKKAKYKEYENKQKLYVTKLMKEILVNRQRLLAAASVMPPGENIKVQWWRTDEQMDVVDTDGQPKRIRNNCMQLTVCKRYRSVIKEINEENDRADTSSDEEDILTDCMKNPAYASALQQLEHFQPSVFDTHDAKPRMPNGEGPVRPSKRPVSPLLMNDETYFEMLKKHKRRRMDAFDAPELNTEGTTLEDIMARTYGRHAVKLPKSVKGIGKKKSKKAKYDGSMPALWQPGLDDHGVAMDTSSIKDESDVEIDLANQPQMYVQAKVYGQQPCFFSVLRNLVIDEQDNKITTFKIEQKVCDWQKSDCAVKNTWFNLQENWSDVTQSALKFLAGHIIGVEIDNFVPYLDYRERAQLWRWIGQGRDEDAQLRPLCEQWLQYISTHDVHASRDRSSTPPPRCPTDYEVTAPTDEDKEVFQEQELMRFENPHEAYTYYMHGYESVVGPVKGVYDKPENEHAMKARDHTLLVKDRPSYVTILTLVRDAAARLPNGSGTRADICELLKYSQYLAPDASDTLVNSVVSGALDRLQYEKDPCVKYSAARKIWIYLHRNRSEEDFNHIHQTQGKAAKAKQALAKPKTGRKSKETASTVSAAQPAPTAASLLNQVPESLRTLYERQRNLYQQSQQQRVANTAPKIITINPSATVANPSPRSTPGGRMVEVTPGSASVSGLDILSSVAQAKISGPSSVDVSKTLVQSSPQLLQTKVITTSVGGRKRLTVAQQGADASSQSLLASHLIGTPQQVTAIPAAQNKIKPVQTGSKPVAFSLLQTSTVSKLLESQGKSVQRQVTQPKTVVIGSKQGIAGQQVITTMKQSGGRTVVIPQNSQTVTSQVLSPVTMAKPSTPGVPAGIRPVLGSPVSGQKQMISSTAGGKPVLARLIGQPGGQQVITLAGGQKAVVSSGVKQIATSLASGPATTIVQTKVSSTGDTQAKRPIILQRVSSIDQSQTMASPQTSIAGSKITVMQKGQTPVNVVKTSTPTIVQVPAAGKPATLGGKQVIIGGKTMTLSSVGGKPVAISSGKPVNVSGPNQLQIGGKPVQTVQIGGKPVQLSGTPIQIGGKPVQISGKPIQIAGKPVQIRGQPVQVGGKPLQIGGKPVQISSKPVQIGGKPVQIGGKPVQFSMIQQQSPQNSPSQTPVAGSPAQSPARQSVSQAVTLPQSVVQQLIQSGQLKTSPQTTVKAVQGSALQHVLSGGTIGGQTIKVQTQPQGHAVHQTISKTVNVSASGSGGGSVVLGEGAKLVAVSQSGVRAATPQRIILQSSASSPQQLTAGKPGLQAGGMVVRPTQNVQVVRTVVSGGQTIVTQQGTSAIRAQSGSKPVYARIINQSAGTSGAANIRFTTVPRASTPQGQLTTLQGQSLGQGQIRAVQNVGAQIRTVSGVNIVQTVRPSHSADRHDGKS